MKKHIAIALTLAVVLSGTSHANNAAKPLAAKKPTTANKAAAAKQPAKDDPKEEALKARYGSLLKSYRKSLLALEADSPRLMDVWVELRDTMAERDALHGIWGRHARKAAEKRKLSIDVDVAKLKTSFDKYYDVAEKKLEKVSSKRRKELDKLLSRTVSSNERAQAIHNEACSKLRDEIDNYQQIFKALGAMDRSISGKGSSQKTVGRFSQIGISGHGGPTAVFKAKNSPYRKVVEAAFDVKDCKADLEVLTVRKAEGKNWSMRDDGALKAAQARLEKAGLAIEKLVARDKLKLDREIAKLSKDIERLERRIEGAREGSSSQERYQEEKWNLESVLLGQEQIRAKLIQFADWKPKPKPVKKKAAAQNKPAPKKNAGH